jgi:hypothetical protein
LQTIAENLRQATPDFTENEICFCCLAAGQRDLPMPEVVFSARLLPLRAQDMPQSEKMF